MKLAVHSQLGRAAETFSALVALVGRSTRVDHHVLQKFALIRKPPVTLVALKAEAGFVRELEFSEPCWKESEGGNWGIWTDFFSYGQCRFLQIRIQKGDCEARNEMGHAS